MVVLIYFLSIIGAIEPRTGGGRMLYIQESNGYDYVLDIEKDDRISLDDKGEKTFSEKCVALLAFCSFVYIACFIVLFIYIGINDD